MSHHVICYAKHAMSCHNIMSHHMICHVIPCHAMPHHVIPCHVTSCHVTLCHVTYTAAPPPLVCGHAPSNHCTLAGLQKVLSHCKHILLTHTKVGHA